MMTPFHHLHAPESNLFYQRNDPNDIRLGEVVTTDMSRYEAAKVVIIGCPQDEGVQRNKGRIGAAGAPREIRRAFYRLVMPEHLNVEVLDMGNTLIQPTLEETHATHSAIIEQLIADCKCVISLGGGNDVSYADCVGLVSAVDSVLAINVDAHFDVRADTVRNSGTPYRQLIEEGFIQPENFYEVASIPMVNSPIYRDYLLNKNAHIYDLAYVQQNGLDSTFRDILKNDTQAIFWGLDMDVVRVADAPGVSAINPLGLTGHEFYRLGKIAGQDSRTRLFEITEVNPLYDIDSRTAKLAAATIHAFLSHLKF